MDDDEVDRLSRAFDELGAAMRRGRAKSAASSASGLTPAQFELLRALRDQGAGNGVQVSTLAAAAGLAGPTVTRMLHALDRRGLTRRRSSDDDGRARYVVLTAEGEQQLQTYQDDLRAKQRMTFATFDRREREVLLETLRRLISLADEHSGHPADGAGDRSK